MLKREWVWWRSQRVPIKTKYYNDGMKSKYMTKKNYYLTNTLSLTRLVKGGMDVQKIGG